MSIIYVLIPIAVLLTAIGLYLFFWAVKTEQFDDLEKQGLSILFDENEEQGTDKVNDKVTLESSQDGSESQSSIKSHSSDQQSKSS